jgi:hypothetical protein
MSSSSTNKQPLLVDRPLHTFAILGASPCLSSPANFSSLVAGGLLPLVDCSGNDGGVIDSLSIIANQAGTTAVSVLFYVSSSPTVFGITEANTALVASAVVGSTAAGERTNVLLPPLSVPVPNTLGAFTFDGSQVIDFDAIKKNTGLYIPAGVVLYVGISAAILAPTPLTKINVFAQGGLF